MDVRDVEVLAVLRRLEVDQSWEQQYHIPPFVHDRCTAVRAADFAGELVHRGLLRALIPAKVVNALGEVDVFFVEDGSPLEGCSCMDALANGS